MQQPPEVFPATGKPRRLFWVSGLWFFSFCFRLSAWLLASVIRSASGFQPGSRLQPLARLSFSDSPYRFCQFSFFLRTTAAPAAASRTTTPDTATTDLHPLPPTVAVETAAVPVPVGASDTGSVEVCVGGWIGG